MKLILKLFPEITIKSQSVRLHFIKILTKNIRNILKNHDTSVIVIRYWDHIEVRSNKELNYSIVANVLSRIPGIHHILIVEERPWQNIHDIYLQTLSIYRHRLIGKSFCVRVKRRGTHNFTSQDIERYLGEKLKHNIDNSSIQLTKSEEKVQLELNNNQLLLIIHRLEGLGGFPIGTQEDVLSLISGGFDSSVSSYMLMRRGCRVHYCFFNLTGTIAYEMGVRQIAHHLWYRYGQSHKVYFISLNFAQVLNEILTKIHDRFMSIILKRMMIRSASAIAERYNFQALVTGEVLGQVSTQTLANLNIINETSNMLILRPLISHDKEHIITLARQIGTEEYVKSIPEYCAILSKYPTIKAIRNDIEREEKKFNFNILNTAIISAHLLNINELVIKETNTNITPVNTTTLLSSNDVILDIRSPNEQKACPLTLTHVRIQTLPFYKLSDHFKKLDQSNSYLLYCNHGTMSYLQALYLREQGFLNVKVYRP